MQTACLFMCLVRLQCKHAATCRSTLNKQVLLISLLRRTEKEGVFSQTIAIDGGNAKGTAMWIFRVLGELMSQSLGLLSSALSPATEQRQFLHACMQTKPVCLRGSHLSNGSSPFSAVAFKYHTHQFKG